MGTELGTDNAAVLYSQNQQILAAVNIIKEELASVSPKVTNSAASQAAVEAAMTSVLDMLTAIKADTIGITDQNIETKTVADSILVNVTALGDGMTMSRLETAVTELQESHNKIITMVEKISEEVGPVISKLENSPIIKMLGGK